MSKEQIVQKTIDIKIMGKEYRVGCPEGEEDSLTKAAHYLDQKMDEIKQGGKIIGTERIAVMAALNLANDLLNKDSVSDQHSAKTEQKIAFLTAKVEQVILDIKG